MGRKANDTYDEFKRFYFKHPKGTCRWEEDNYDLL